MDDLMAATATATSPLNRFVESAKSGLAHAAAGRHDTRERGLGQLAVLLAKQSYKLDLHALKPLHAYVDHARTHPGAERVHPDEPNAETIWQLLTLAGSCSRDYLLPCPVVRLIELCKCLPHATDFEMAGLHEFIDVCEANRLEVRAALGLPGDDSFKVLF